MIGRKTGTGSGKARRKLETSKRLAEQPNTDGAVRRGEVSGEQAAEVSGAAAISPESEDELLASARHEPMHQLQKRAAEARARADKDREATRRRLHAQRQVRRWDDADGMGNLLLKMPASELRELDASLKTAVDRRLADARHAGRFEPVEAYAADEVMDRLLGPDRRIGSRDVQPGGAAGQEGDLPDRHRSPRPRRGRGRRDV